MHFFNSFFDRVASHSAQNNMTPDNLAIVVGPNILKSPEMMSGNVHKTFARIFKVVELMIRHVDTVFVNVAEQRRALLEAAKDEAAREVLLIFDLLFGCLVVLIFFF